MFLGFVTKKERIILTCHISTHLLYKTAKLNI